MSNSIQGWYIDSRHVGIWGFLLVLWVVMAGTMIYCSASLVYEVMIGPYLRSVEQARIISRTAESLAEQEKLFYPKIVLEEIQKSDESHLSPMRTGVRG